MKLQLSMEITKEKELDGDFQDKKKKTSDVIIMQAIDVKGNEKKEKCYKTYTVNVINSI